jgi:paraquat-inducible protein B
MAQPSPPPKARIRKIRRFRLSYVWIVPLIAAVVGAYLFYKAEIDVGPVITITFEDGTDISSGSKVVYRGVQVGVVEAVALDAGLGHVNVRARLDKSASGLAREGSQFWIVEPRVSIDQITGLDTLLAGSYIEVAPGGGAAATRFVGLAAPPAVPSGEQVLALVLEADDANLLQIGDPVTYAASRWARLPASRCRSRGRAFASTSRSRPRMRGWCAATRASGWRAAFMPI